MKTVIAIDSFKGCLSSSRLGAVIAEAIHDIDPSAEVVQMPIADGGEGWVDALLPVVGGEKITCRVQGPLRHPVEATYGWSASQRLAVIEMAAASGLCLIPSREGNVMHTTTYGTGELIADALQRGCRRILLGIGGSATNDAGVGMLQALGFRFLSDKGREVADGGIGLEEVSRVDRSAVNPLLKTCRIEVATDVRNPFYGPQGAASVFAPQKGASPEQVKRLDSGLRHFAEWAKEQYKVDLQQCPGAGAAGGMGGGSLLFLEATLTSGIEMVKSLLHFDEQIRNADFIITGEGRIDSQTEQGKLLSGILQAAHSYAVPVIALTGDCSAVAPSLDSDPLLSVFSIHSSPVSLEKAMDPDYAAEQLRRTVRSLAKLMILKKMFADKR